MIFLISLIVLVSSVTSLNIFPSFLGITEATNLSGSLLGVRVTFSSGVRIRTSKKVTGGRLEPGIMALFMSNLKSLPKSGICKRAIVNAINPAVPLSQYLSVPRGRTLFMSSLLAFEEACFCTSFRKVSESGDVWLETPNSTAESKSSLNSGEDCSRSRASFFALGSCRRGPRQVFQIRTKTKQ